MSQHNTALHRRPVWQTRLALCGLVLAAAMVLGDLAGNALFRRSGPPWTIAVDPGHGGEDGGAISCTGRSDSGYNLQIALRLNDLLQLLGYDTVMIRSTDTSVYTSGQTISQKKVSDLKQRVRIVDRTYNALLLSIHQNTFPEEKYSGAQVFYGKAAGSEELAKELQDALVAALNPGSSRKAKQGSGIYLLDKTNATGVLVECGFLSNRQEEAKLRSPDYQKKLCCVISATTARFLASGS